MDNKQIRELIEEYIEAYNSFDVEKMLSLMDENVVFRNIANGEVNLETRGIEELHEIAEQSCKMFLSRCQTVKEIRILYDVIEVDIDYEGILAIDLLNGLKSGDKMDLSGKSVFKIKNGKFLVIEDYS